MTNPAPPVDDARDIIGEIRARFERNYTNMCLGAELSHIGQMQVVSDVGSLLRALDAALLSRIPSEEATEEEVDRIFESYDGTMPATDISGSDFIELLSQHGLRITRAPGAKT